MPIVRHFPKEARVSGLSYQLDLERRPKDETKFPCVLCGNPALCRAHENENRLRNSSTNHVVSWLEFMPSGTSRETCRILIEEVILAGCPKGQAPIAVIRHEEPGRLETATKAAGRTKRPAGRKRK